jgi:interferon-induced GTP-binding protein Mx
VRIGTGFSEVSVIVELSSPNVPDLTLIDLPGIARVSTQGQSADLPMKIKKMIKGYISDENTIILVVVNGCNDLATTEGLKFAQEVDPQGIRTVGVITKIDLVDKGAEGEVQKALQNEVFKLELVR